MRGCCRWCQNSCTGRFLLGLILGSSGEPPPLQPRIIAVGWVTSPQLTGAALLPGLAGGREIISDRCKTMSSPRQSCSSHT